MQSLRAKLQDEIQSREALQHPFLEIVENLNIEQTQALQKETEEADKKFKKKANKANDNDDFS